jgi:hypothetical protein
MAATLTTPDNKTIEKPAADDLAAALHGVLGHEDEHADLWLEHDSGWTLSVTRSGDLFLEDLTGDEEEYWTLGPLPEEEILPLMAALAKGDVRAVRALKWERGE